MTYYILNPVETFIFETSVKNCQLGIDKFSIRYWRIKTWEFTYLELTNKALGINWELTNKALGIDDYCLWELTNKTIGIDKETIGSDE
jgi:hypothetical protein